MSNARMSIGNMRIVRIVYGDRFMNREDIGQRLKEVRTFLKMNQTEFGRAIGKGLRAVQHYEAGERSIDETLVILLELKFKINPEWLKEGKGNMVL